MTLILIVKPKPGVDPLKITKKLRPWDRRTRHFRPTNGKLWDHSDPVWFLEEARDAIEALSLGEQP